MPANTPDAGTSSERRNVALIIDDESTVRSALRRYFMRKGWDVEEAADGASGLQLLSDGSDRFSVGLCDLRMPGFSGLELHDELAISNPRLLRGFVFTTGDVTSPEASAFLNRTA